MNEMDEARRVYDAFNASKQECPECGQTMKFTSGLLDWECPNCGAEGITEYDSRTHEYYILIPHEYSYDEIYSDPIGNMPSCCKACGGPYPSCMISCKIFDD